MIRRKGHCSGKTRFQKVTRIQKSNTSIIKSVEIAEVRRNNQKSNAIEMWCSHALSKPILLEATNSCTADNDVCIDTKHKYVRKPNFSNPYTIRFHARLAFYCLERRIKYFVLSFMLPDIISGYNIFNIYIYHKLESNVLCQLIVCVCVVYWYKY